MSDFDFDELDKAMSSLNNTSDDQERSQISDSDRPKVNSDRPMPSLATRRTPGPFMDVMHPSSNMTRSASRPLGGDNNKASLATPTSASSMTSPSDSPANKTVDSQLNPDSFPDKSSSVDESIEKITPAVPANEEDDDINKISDDINKTLGISDGSPFIADAKVDKRPLGAFSSDSESTDQPEESLDSTTTPLPAELDGNLLSIEANSVAKPLASDVNQNIVDTTIETTKPEEVKTESSERAVDDAKSLEYPMSVPQQYTKEANPEPAVSQTYNKDTYKQTLVPAKKKAGWLWVVWILLLILIGAGIGAAVYFFVL